MGPQSVDQMVDQKVVQKVDQKADHSDQKKARNWVAY